MDGQITIEEMQAIIGKLTLNYEIHIKRLMAELQRLGSELEATKSPQGTNAES